MSDSFPPSPPGAYECTADDSAKILEELEQLKRENNYLRSRVRYLESGRSKCKTSKWSKVKGAFGWEKDKENSLTLKVPEQGLSDQSSSFSVSPAGSCLSHSSLTTPPLLLSSSSSEEDILHDERRCNLKTTESERRKNNEQSRRSKSLDGDPTLSMDEHGPKVSSNKPAIAKGNKTPWSKVKGIINTKSVRKRSAQEERWGASALMNEAEAEEHSLDEDACGSSTLNTPKLTVTLPSNEELSSEPPKKRLQRSSSKLEHSGEKSKWFKVRNVFLQGSRSAPSSPIRSASFTYDLEDDLSSGDVLDDKEYDIFRDEERLKYEVEASYVELQNKLEEELSKKYCREVNLSPEFKKKLEEWDKMKGGSCAPREWENDKEKKKKDRTERGGKDKEWDKTEDTRKPQSREGSFRKHQNPQGARQEVLIPTSTGTFRFEGISDNFTKKLYEWEKARGIAPEASTFALLGPEYQPTCCRSEARGQGNNGGLTRSKSIGSIADLGQGGQTLVQQPSSLSLNDMDEISHCASLSTGVNRTSPGGDMTSPEPLFRSDFASHLAKMTSSSSSNEEKCGAKDHFLNQMDNSNYQLLHDNIILLDKLKKERDVCRQLEDDMKTLEGQINSVSKSFLVDQAASARYERDHGFDEYQLGPSFGDDHMDLMSEHIPCTRISPMRDYMVKLQDFTEVQTTLYDDEATQTNEFDDSIRYLFHDGFPNGLHSDLTPRQSTAAQKTVSELQDLAERLEVAAMDKENDSSLIQNGFAHKEEFPCDCWSNNQNYSTYTLPTHWLRSRSSMCNLTKMLNEKLSELKQILNSATAGTEYSSPPPPMTGSLHRTTAHEDLSPGEMNPEEFRPLSRASSGASSFSYHVSHGSSSKLHHDWQPYSFHHHLNYIYDQGDPSMDRQNAMTGSYTDATSDGDISDSELRVNTPNVFVPTMRKIFSPVSDSEAVGVIIAEEDESTEVENQEEEENDRSEQEDTDAEEAEADDKANENDEEPSTTPQDVIQNGEELGNEQTTSWFSPQIRLRAKSSSPAIERKTPKFSSVCLFFPTSENGVVSCDLYPQQVPKLPLGEELASSLKMRALKLKRAKEDFLMNQEREGSLSIVVNEDILNQATTNGLMVRSASDDFAHEIEKIDEHSEQMEQKDTQSILGILKLRRKKSKDKGDVVELTRNSVCLVPEDASGSQSCPNTPVFDKKAESGAASWIKNPAKMIFRPKGKYTITNQ